MAGTVSYTHLDVYKRQVLIQITVMPEVTGMERCFSVTPLLVEAKAFLTGGQMPGKRLI